ncbi:hypothetical protein SEA_EVY_115 [Streptomyces phage Evy]|uniref:Uncharacterized protein n=2 Tax=Samistivirus TaxID=2560220 RepID=A0A222YZY9_9CAUD|nr:hypothetical protein FDI36_gp148 [Streptomyces phage NootNoot]YP_010103486.1 hypothetical protein KNU67_gp155 [Streptomyces phage Evy]ASR77374.1 hypothetical protein SEA_NOOTNOOT_114 [Streptomyces phage NootNoot]QDH93977.1 hypothetical protein SEA_EVY_115 [Streptomyces phage Evy]UEM46898.1 hypothetical protein SEA_TARGARYEN_118 [Streptomyces phage Targaryen]
MRLFELHRDIDESGVSGTGKVTQGVQFDDGQVCMLWLTALKGYPQVYPHIERVLEIHGHDGKTRVVWLDEKPGRTVKVAGKEVPVHTVDRFSENR